MKNISGYQILVWSENPDKLQKFYRDTLELKPQGELSLPDDYGYSFKVGKQRLWIGKHSEVSGKNPDKFRFIINFYVDDVHAWHEKLIRRGVRMLTKPFMTPPTRDKKEKRYAFTFFDPEGNCLQIMSAK